MNAGEEATLEVALLERVLSAFMVMAPVALAAVLLLAPAAPREVYQLNLAVDIPVTLVAGSVGFVRAFLTDKLARISCPCDPAGLNAIDRGTVGNRSHAASVAADVTVYGTMFALPLLDLFDLGVSRAFGEDFVVYVETLAVNTAIQNMVNFAVARPRPLAYAGDPAFQDTGAGYQSFYAGHVATAFAALSAASFTLHKRYGTGIWPWLTTGLIGTSVALERVVSGHHFPTDVAVAAVMGTAIGITVPWLHTRTRSVGLAIVPVPVAGGQGAGLAGTF